MKLFGLGLVKNEVDVLEQSARHALRWCERLHYLDNGSDDGTWELIEHLAKATHGRVVAVGRHDGPFSDGLRGLVYDEVRHSLGRDDWWLQLDADEFIEGDPRPAIRAAAAEGHNRIRVWQAQFAFTDEDLAEWEAGRDDRTRPIQERRRWYRADWRESRLWRHDPGRAWGSGSQTYPEWADSPSRWSLVNRHYQYRDPEQIQRRVADRHGVFPHVTSPEWRAFVTPTAGLRHLGDGDVIHVDRVRFAAGQVGHRLRQRGRRLQGVS